jgi:hypothetical protein
MPVPVPADPGFSGASFHFEWAILDFGGPTGVASVSDALTVTVI